MELAIWPQSMIAAGKYVLQADPPASATVRRNLWLKASSAYPLFAAAAVRLLSCHQG